MRCLARESRAKNLRLCESLAAEVQKNCDCVKLGQGLLHTFAKNLHQTLLGFTQSKKRASGAPGMCGG